MTSPTSLRLARNDQELGIPFPQVGDDDLERYVVREATLLRYHEERRRQMERLEREREAREASRGALEEMVGRKLPPLRSR